MIPTRLALALLAACASLPAAAFDCPETPAPVRDIRANSYYSDAAGSVVDKDLHELYQRNIGPITDYQRRIVALADGYVESGEAAQGACVVSWLKRWASGGALLGEIYNERGNQADYIQKWTLASVAMAAFKVRDQLGAADHALIDPWLKAQAARVTAFWDNPAHRRNNHLTWSALAVAATAAVTGDEALWRTARGFYDESIAQIQADGSLPHELERAGRALHYHNYTLMPLATMAELARWRGEDWYARGGASLLRLADLTAASLLDPSGFEKRTGKKQFVPEGGNLSWTVWLQEQPLHERAAVKTLAARGPFLNTQMGGNPALTRRSIEQGPAFKQEK